ncbi:MAG TPA: heme-binding protein [Solirubrobacteraceae bacterium]|nr:heme-binding protein [Solirubrobacteraceae bacterium]
MHVIDIPLSDARRLIARAIDKAAHIGARGAFAVVGASGALVSASRMDAGGAGGMARARSKAWISATQQIPSAEHHTRMATLPSPIAAGFLACSPEARFPGAGGMPIHARGDPTAPVIGGFSASGATIGPFVDIPGVDRRMLIVEGRPANAEDLIVHWALGLPYRGQHGDDERRWLEAFGELPAEAGSGYDDPPPAHLPEHEWALGLVDRAIAAARERGLRVAVAIVDRRGDPIQQDTVDGAPTAAPFIAEAVAAAAATFQLPSEEVAPAFAAVLPYQTLSVPGGLPIHRDGLVVAALGVAGGPPLACREIAQAVLG